MDEGQFVKEVERSQTGQPTVLSRSKLTSIYKQYQVDICKYIARIFGKGPPDPEDVAQQVFINFIEQGGEEKVLNPRAYLYRIAHNLVMNLHRKASTRRRYIADQSASVQDENVENRHPERILISRERLIVLERTMWEMPAKRRQMVVLNRLKGLTYAEISRQTGLSKSSVRQHVLNGMADFQRALRMQELTDHRAEPSK